MFDAGPMPPKDAQYSGDGYHFAYAQSDSREDRWIVDGRVRVRGALGELSGPSALSENGSVLFHFLAVPGGLAPAVNGRRIGKAVYTEIDQVRLSRSGRNAAFAARTDAGWVVVSGQGMGPAFEKPPVLLGASEDGTAYVVEWSGSKWLYRDHKPIRAVPYQTMSFSSDLRRFGGKWRTSDYRDYVEIDGKRTGPFLCASAPSFSPDGRRAGYLAGEEPGQWGECTFAVVDGVKTAVKPCFGCALILDDGGRPFEDKTLFVVDEKAQLHDYFYRGREIGKGPSLGTSAAHYGLTILGSDERGIGFALDGKMIDAAAPLALAFSAPVFDGSREYHYWSLNGRNLSLACGSTEGGDACATRCAAIAGGLGWPPARNETPPASPVSAP